MFWRSSDQKKIGSETGPDQDRTGPVLSKPVLSKPTIQDGGIDLQKKERIKKIKISAKTDPDQRSGPDRTAFDPRSDGPDEHSLNGVRNVNAVHDERSSPTPKRNFPSHRLTIFILEDLFFSLDSEPQRTFCKFLDLQR